MLGRNFPIVRTLISFPIGVTRLNVYKFMFYSLIGSIPWTFAFVFAGYTLGDKWEQVMVFVEWFKIPIVLALAALVMWYLYIKVYKVKGSK